MSNNVTVLSAEDAIIKNGSDQTTTEQPASITSKQLGELQDRFAIIPLYTNHYEYALNGEFMIDPLAGTPGIKLANGKVVMVGEEGRLRYHAMQFENELSYYGMRNTPSLMMTVIFISMNPAIIYWMTQSISTTRRKSKNFVYP